MPPKTLAQIIMALRSPTKKPFSCDNGSLQRVFIVIAMLVFFTILSTRP